MRLYEAIAIACDAARRCAENGNTDWLERWNDRLDAIERDYLPSGGGFDSGSTIDRDASGRDRIVIETSFHHMDDGGMYDGWTEHKVTVIPDFVVRFAAKVSGRDRNAIKDYIADCFDASLDSDIAWSDLDPAELETESPQ